MRQGFTLMEMIIALIIVGILLVIILPNVFKASEQTRAQMASNNLYAIAAAEEKYYEDYSLYCTSTAGNVIPCADTTSDINTNLRLGISDQFNYTCTTIGSMYQCTCRDGTDTLTLTVVNNGLGVSVNCAGSACPS